MRQLSAEIFIRCLFILLLSIIVGSCDAFHEERDSWTDNYLMDYLCVKTNQNGEPITAILDDGQQFSIQPYTDTFPADTLLRCVAWYKRSLSTIQIADMAVTFGHYPIVVSRNLITCHPLQVQAIWMSGHYLNMKLEVPGKDGSHMMAFVADTIINNTQTNVKTAYLTLYHDSNKDTPAFHRTLYASCPLHCYDSLLTFGKDSIYFVINEENKGQQIYKYLFTK